MAMEMVCTNFNSLIFYADTGVVSPLIQKTDIVIENDKYKSIVMDVA